MPHLLRATRALWFAALLLALAAACGARQTAALPLSTALEGSAAEPQDTRLDWWREARFGLFIHWGLYAIPAGEWQGGTDHAEWIRTTARIPLEEYDEFVERFDPVDFDARAWVALAKAAGMKYVVITSKHHDGFGLWDSQLTDFDVMSTPFGRDILAELAEACREAGLAMCWYHSIMDWHHPDYLPRRGWETARSSEGADFERYVEYLHGQVEELLTNYGEIGVMWFDGEWEGTWNHEYGQALYDLCRRLQPDVIVNNRVDKGRGGMAGMTTEAKYAGDFGTPEQEIPSTGLPGVDWETCMTMNRHWGWNARDEDWKSSADLVRKLIDIASKGGNFLLNVGPTARGTFPPESVERLRDIGRWMDVNGEAIHGTEAGPIPDLAWGRCTLERRGDTSVLYLHVFDWPRDGSLSLPGLGNQVRRAWLLADAERPVAVRRASSDLILDLPAVPLDELATVVALEIEGAPIVYQAPQITADAEIFVGPLEVRLEARSAGLELRYTLDGAEPDGSSSIYRRPLLLRETTLVKARAFHGGRPVSAVTERRFSRVTPRPAAFLEGLREGLACSIHAGDWDQLPDFTGLAPEQVEIVPTIGLPAGPSRERVARRFEGYLRVSSDDAYAFSLTSDDGSRLWLDGKLVVDHDGLHGTSSKRGVVALAAGHHALVVEWFNKTGGASLELEWAPVGRPLTPMPAGALQHDPRTR